MMQFTNVPNSLRQISDPPVAKAPAAELATKGNLDGLRVLLVDDDPDQHYLVRGFFRGFNVVVDGVESAAAALARLQQQTYDLLVLDVMMPGMDGWELFSELRQLPCGESLPVVFLTCVMEPQHEQRMADVSARCVTLSKPTTKSRFHRAVRLLLGR